MLKIEEMEDNLFLIELNVKETVKFRGVFEAREDVDVSTLKPKEKGMKLEVDLDK